MLRTENQNLATSLDRSVTDAQHRTKESAKVMPKSELSQVGEKVKINLADGDTLYHQVAT
jgi:hypothetical protein